MSLYLFDGAGRLTAANGDPEREPPAFHLVRTTEGNRHAIRASLPAAAASALATMLDAEPVGPDRSALDTPPRGAAAIERALDDHGIDREPGYRGPAYVLPQPDEPTAATVITAQNHAVLTRHFPWAVEDRRPMFVVLEGGDAVSICRPATELGAAAEAGVETVDRYRGRGYASQVVAAWAAEIYRLGRLPLYSTWHENGPSITVASKLGALHYGDVFHLG